MSRSGGWSCSPPRSRYTRRDHTGFLVGGGADQLRALAERLTAVAHPPSVEVASDAARAWTLLGHAAWLRADRATELDGLTRAIRLFEPLPDSAETIDACAELARLHMLYYEFEPAIADRLGLAEAAANAEITIATARYESGDPVGLAELHQVVQRCRDRQLLALRRATRNLAHAVR